MGAGVFCQQSAYILKAGNRWEARYIVINHAGGDKLVGGK